MKSITKVTYLSLGVLALTITLGAAYGLSHKADEPPKQEEHFPNVIQVNSKEKVALGGSYFKDNQFIYSVDDEHRDSFFKLDMADYNSFVFMGGRFGKDKNHVFYDREKVAKADSGSFEFLGGNFAKDKDTVFWRDAILYDADVASFTVLSNSLFAQDLDTAYYRGSEIADADIPTFVVLNDWYAKDKNHVYKFESNDLDFVFAQADPQTFVVFNDAPYYTKDKNHVFYRGEIFEQADVETFTVDKGAPKDKNAVFLGEEVLAGADIESFESVGRVGVNGSFFKDKRYVYCDGSRTDFDPVTFDVIKNGGMFLGGYVKDKSGIYLVMIECPKYKSKVLLEGADVESFEEIISNVDVFYSKDKDHIYYYHDQIKGVDYETFEICRDDYYAKDKNHIYKNGILIKEPDEQAQKACVESYSPADIKEKNH